jgi:acyl-coenzyme A synthetase/AMP-(fatty) acid ligase
MDFGVFTSGGDGSPKGVLHFIFLVACSLSLKKPQIVGF